MPRVRDHYLWKSPKSGELRKDYFWQLPGKIMGANNVEIFCNGDWDLCSVRRQKLHAVESARPSDVRGRIQGRLTKILLLPPTPMASCLSRQVCALISATAHPH